MTVDLMVFSFLLLDTTCFEFYLQMTYKSQVYWYECAIKGIIREFWYRFQLTESLFGSAVAYRMLISSLILIQIALGIDESNYWNCSTLDDCDYIRISIFASTVFSVILDDVLTIISDKEYKNLTLRHFQYKEQKIEFHFNLFKWLFNYLV